MNNFYIRVLTGAVFVAAIVGSIYLSPFLALVLFYLVAIGGMYEFYLGLRSKSYSPQIISGLLAGSLLYFLVSLFALRIIESWFLISGILILPLLGIIELYRNKPQPFINIALTFLGVFYISLPLALLLFLYYPASETSEPNPTVLLSFFILVWVNDSMAYVVGSLIGKNRLFERHSPKKSWEGAIGGLVFSILTACLIFSLSGVYSMPLWILISIIIVILGTFGDLTESMLKRSLNVKDSGTFFPGHGGFLDRFDAIFMASPVVFVCINVFNLFAQ